ncbi:MAG: hypothetical protein ACRD3Q_05575 [Terriglobales bacterium]
MDPLLHIDRIVNMVESARSVPMSASCVLNREELLSALAALRGDLPSELEGARSVLQHRDEVIEVGRKEAERIVTEAQLEQRRLISTHEVSLGAEREASRIVSEAETTSGELRHETNELCETSLANVETLLRRTLSKLELGHQRMRPVIEIPGVDLRGAGDPIVGTAEID